MKSTFAQQLEDAAAIKWAMIEQLIELETKASGRKPEQPGAWRHHPAQWTKENPPADPT